VRNTQIIENQWEKDFKVCSGKYCWVLWMKMGVKIMDKDISE